MSDGGTTGRLERLVERLRAGDAAARWELLERAYGRLRGLASKVLGDFPRVRDEAAWHTTEVASEARLRLAKALEEVRPEDARHFFRLAALKVRQLLLELVRRLPGGDRAGPGAPPPARPGLTRADYGDVVARLLELLPGLPEDQYAVLDLEFSLGLETAEIAAVLGVEERSVRRRRRAAYDAIARVLQGEFPDLGASNGGPA